jgi:N-acetylneuraminate lyase
MKNEVSKSFKGFIAAPMTGFNPDGSINLDIVQSYANMLNANDISGVFVNGTTGQGLSLSVEERKALAECWVKFTPSGLRVIVHVGHKNQSQSNLMAIHANEIGADAVAMMVPSLNLKSVHSLADYIQLTANLVSSLPFYYYHLPSETNLFLPMIELLKVSQKTITNFAGIKYTHDDLTDFKLCKEFCDGKYEILFGRDEFLIEGLKIGAQSAVGSTYNIMAPLYHELINAFQSGDLIYANNLQEISKNTCSLLNATGSFRSGCKAVMRMIGIDLGDMRAPDLNISSRTINELKSSLKSIGMLNFLNKA